MLQVIGFADADGDDHALRIPVRIRGIEIGAPADTPTPALACRVHRARGAVATPLATISGLELAAAPRSAAASNTKRAPFFVNLPRHCLVAVQTISSLSWAPRRALPPPATPSAHPAPCRSASTCPTRGTGYALRLLLGLMRRPVTQVYLCPAKVTVHMHR